MTGHLLEAALRQRTQVGNELHAIARAALHLASDIDGLAAAVGHILDHLQQAAARPATAPQPAQAHGDADDPARPAETHTTPETYDVRLVTRRDDATLHDMPVGTVIRADGKAYVHTDAWEWVETVTGTAWTADELTARHPHWHAIHTPQEPE